MSWLKLEGGPILTKEQADALVRILNAIDTYADDEGNDALDVLQSIANDGVLTADDTFDALAKHLAESYLDEKAEKVVAQLRLMRRTLKDLEQEKNEADRTIGWPKLSWSEEGTANDFSYVLKAQGGVAYVVAADDASAGETHAATALKLNGKTEGEASRSLSPLPLKGRVGAHLGASMQYNFVFPNDVRAGFALADSMMLSVMPLDQFNEVSTAFGKTSGFVSKGGAELGDAPLQSVRAAYEAGVDLSLKGNVTMPIKGTFKGSLEFKTKLGRQGALTIKRKDATGAALRVTLSEEGAKSGEISVGLGYKIGLSEISPKFAKDLLEALVDSKELLDKLDGYVGRAETEVETWLKPGTRLKSFIHSQLGAVLDGTGPEDLVLRHLASLAGLLPEENNIPKIKEYITGELSDALDDTLALFGTDSEVSVALLAIRKEFASDLDTLVAGKLDDILVAVNAELITALSAVKSQITDAAGNLDNATREQVKAFLGHDPKDVFAAIKSVFKDARKKLDKATEGLQKAMDDALSIEIAWARSQHKTISGEYSIIVSAEGEEWYRQLIRSPRAAVKALLDNPNGIPGIDLERSVVAGSLNSTESSGVKLSVLGLTVDDKAKSISDVKIRSTQNGIAVLSKGEAKREISFFGTTRASSFINVLSFGSNEEESAPRLELKLQEDDETLEEKEVAAFVDSFTFHGILQDAVARDLLAAYNAAAEGKSKIDGSLSISLALPSDRTYQMIRGTAKIKDDALAKIACNALAQSSRTRDQIVDLLDDLRVSRSKALSNLNDKGVSVSISNNGLPEKYDKSSIDYAQVIQNIGPIYEGYRQLYAHDVGVANEHYKLAGKLNGAREGFVTAFRTMHEALVAMEGIHTGRQLDTQAVSRKLDEMMDRQERINRAIAPWLDPSNKWIALENTTVVALFLALQELATTAIVLGDGGTVLAPSILVGIKPEGQRARQFISGKSKA